MRVITFRLVVHTNSWPINAIIRLTKVDLPVPPGPINSKNY